jgi:hypothetical protein
MNEMASVEEPQVTTYSNLELVFEVLTVSKVS